ncbi:MAG: ABC transporter permease [Candidatus Bathyarchaeota archaeon]|nr:ABC transporter permease [Candidatus Bathyarchaeota archaeon]
MTVTDVTTKKRPSPFWELLKVQGKLAIREPTGLVFGIGLPLILLIIFGNIPTFNQPVEGSSFTIFEVYIPILLVTVLIFLSLFGLPIPIVRDREVGWLRRISTTPVSPAKLLAAQVTINLILAAVGFIILIAGSTLVFGIRITFDIPGFILSLVLATLVMFSLGLLVTAIAPSQSTANGITMALLYPLLFFAGIYVPIQVLPSGLQTAALFTPVGAAVNALDSSMAGSFPSFVPLVVMAAYTVIFGFVAIRYFRWE